MRAERGDVRGCILRLQPPPPPSPSLPPVSGATLFGAKAWYKMSPEDEDYYIFKPLHVVPLIISCNDPHDEVVSAVVEQVGVHSWVGEGGPLQARAGRGCDSQVLRSRACNAVQFLFFVVLCTATQRVAVAVEQRWLVATQKHRAFNRWHWAVNRWRLAMC